MKLRARVALTLLAIVLPVALVFGLYQLGNTRREIQERASERALTRLVHTRLARCERAPRAFHPARRGVEIFAYDVDRRPWAPNAPAFPAPLLEGLDEVGEPISQRFWTEPAEGATAIRTDSEVCTYLVAYWHAPPARPRPGVVLGPTALLAALLLVTGALISFPLVRRIRRLTEAVQNAHDTGYRIDEQIQTSDELGELARAFDDAGRKVAETIDTLEARDRTLQEFIANTTHDLAIPLTVLQHRLHRLGEELHEARHRDLIHTALEESHYIAALVKNMNVAAKLDAPEVHVERHATDLSALVERVLERHRPIADTKDIEIAAATPDDPVIAEVDSVLVEQALSNLVQNAVQYTAREGHIAIVLERNPGGFEIKVMDDGPGVPDALLPRLLERSARGDDARTRNPEGQGFGLNIARRVCDLHGWTLSLENARPGLTVTLRGKL